MYMICAHFIRIHTYIPTYLPTYIHTHTLRYGSVRNAMRVDMVMKMYTP